jgi:hypothetical protein
MKKKGQKAVDREGALKTIRTLLPERIANFVEMQMDLHSKLKKGQRYSQETKAFRHCHCTISAVKPTVWYPNYSTFHQNPAFSNGYQDYQENQG